MRIDSSVRKYAQFAHFLFAWLVDNIDNSGVYKLLKQAPYFKREDSTNIKDLEFVRDQFKLIDLAAGVELVQKEIDSIKKG